MTAALSSLPVLSWVGLVLAVAAAAVIGWLVTRWLDSRFPSIPPAKAQVTA